MSPRRRRLPPPPPPCNTIFVDGPPLVMTGETYRATVEDSRRIDHQAFSSLLGDGGVLGNVVQDLALPEGASEAAVRDSVARWERNLPGKKVRDLALYRQTYTPAPGRRAWQHALSVAVARHIAKARLGFSPAEIADIAEDLTSFGGLCRAYFRNTLILPEEPATAPAPATAPEGGVIDEEPYTITDIMRMMEQLMRDLEVPETVNAGSSNAEQVPPTMNAETSNAEQVPPTVNAESSNAEQVPPTVNAESSNAQVPLTVNAESSNAEQVPPTVNAESSNAQVPETVNAGSSNAEQVPPTMNAGSSNDEQVPPNVNAESSNAQVPETVNTESSNAEQVPPTVNAESMLNGVLISLAALKPEK